MPATDIVKRWLRALADRDLDRLRTLMVTDFTLEESTVLPWGGVYYGPDGFFEYFLRRHSMIDAIPHIDQIFDAGNRIIVIADSQGIVRGTGHPIHCREVTSYQVRDTRIARCTLYEDTPTMLGFLADS
ncbi:nuclear transport factor 2 family protein [Nocardia sp. NPDC088792]|uniref:nuclear transport factor 2 family protein n=1 Tax=Nocardia sp. NPDC088792 TaxID=3364332 RepID=UPI00381A9066